MPQRVSSEVLGHLITALSGEIVDAHIHWRLHTDLCEAIQAKPVVLYQSRTFWHLTVGAHETLALLHLCRAYDQESSSLHLFRWLSTVKENLGLFAVEAFRQRLADNPFVQSLSDTAVAPDSAELDADIRLCSKADPLVRKLIALRGSTVAHRSYNLAASASSLPSGLLLSVDDFRELLDRARQLLNKYSLLFSATTYSVNMIGRDDYEYIFSAVANEVTRSRSRAEG